MNEVLDKKDYINPVSLLQVKSGVLFVDFIESTVKKKSKRMGKSYSGNYKTLIYHLNNFCIENNAILFTNSIGEEFLDDFIYYLESLFLKKNYIKNILFLTKAMVRKAALYGYLVDSSYDDVDISGEEAFSISLSMNDITRIYYFKGLSNKQERIKDLFIIGCLTALRYSDLSTLTKENFKDGYITKITQKNKIKVVIPIHDLVAEIIEKYNGEIPTKICSQHFNRYIKLICKKIGFDEDVPYTETVGGELVMKTKKKWEMISSHTARRSGATNLYNTGRISVDQIRQITGHTTEKSFMRYIKNTKEEMAKQAGKDNFFKK